MARIHKYSKDEVVQTVAKSFQGTIQTSYSNYNERTKLAMSSIVEHALT